MDDYKRFISEKHILIYTRIIISINIIITWTTISNNEQLHMEYGRILFSRW